MCLTITRTLRKSVRYTRPKPVVEAKKNAMIGAAVMVKTAERDETLLTAKTITHERHATIPIGG